MTSDTNPRKKCPEIIARLRQQARFFTVLAHRNYDVKDGTLFHPMGMTPGHRHTRLYLTGENWRSG